MSIQHHSIALQAKNRGFHLITTEVLQQLPKLPQNGLFQLFIQHTSAGLTINENADPDVRMDFETIFNRLVPENQQGLLHTLEGPDDMPAHIKTAFTGTSLSIPIIQGQLALGTWQGLYLCEFRNYGGRRKLIATIID
ncbi:secondary thiamine-phosphate synthase enzyme [Saprospira grandis DSM 2844]|uniref:Secondary thiamine-phosphate synthase enzyme n=1 Tax=Saprospira grandis DSM 2844 TaxID=694433 RepID=J0XUR2_9BACT|nr:secondary thiamine-phosphate synthase enzyme YjbQ [Saprospira grandis]EJF52681.1 secondary thiamine-phosphate synthase enzyme [Saprospira grandis DSM 2844]